MDLRKIGWEVDSIHLSQDRDQWGGEALVNMLMNLTDCYLLKKGSTQQS
jgi:hypothetical protein